MNSSPNDVAIADARILVAGVARNCESRIRRDIITIAESLCSCKSLSWLVIESDSSDQTVDVLRGHQVEIPNFRFTSLGALSESMPIRTQRIAHCRNVYLDELRSNPLYSTIDYVVIADLDGVNNLVTAEGFASCFARSDWDVCTANQLGPYYDIWALRHPVWSPGDCWKEYDFLVSHKIQREIAAWAAMYSKMITIGVDEEWIPVDSAFGGLAIYRRRSLEGVRYTGIDTAGEPICEHVWLNNQIRSKGYKIFINPKLINTSDTDQSFQRSLPQTLKRCYLDLRHAAKMKILSALWRK